MVVLPAASRPTMRIPGRKRVRRRGQWWGFHDDVRISFLPKRALRALLKAIPMAAEVLLLWWWRGERGCGRRWKRELIVLCLFASSLSPLPTYLFCCPHDHVHSSRRQCSLDKTPSPRLSPPGRRRKHSSRLRLSRLASRAIWKITERIHRCSILGNILPRARKVRTPSKK